MYDAGRTLSSETTNNSTIINDVFKLTKELKKKQKEKKLSDQTMQTYNCVPLFKTMMGTFHLVWRPAL